MIPVDDLYVDGDCYCAAYIQDPDKFCDVTPCINKERAEQDYLNNQLDTLRGK